MLLLFLCLFSHVSRDSFTNTAQEEGSEHIPDLLQVQNTKSPCCGLQQWKQSSMKYPVCTQSKYSTENLSFAIRWHGSRSHVARWHHAADPIFHPRIHLSHLYQEYTGDYRLNGPNPHSVNYCASLSTKMSQIPASCSNIHPPFANHELDLGTEQVQGKFWMYEAEIVRVSGVSRKLGLSTAMGCPGKLWSLRSWR